MIKTDEFSKCLVCVEVKHVKKPFKSFISRKSELFEIIHSDIADFKNIVIKGGKKNYITFVDDFSRH